LRRQASGDRSGRGIGIRPHRDLSRISFQDEAAGVDTKHGFVADDKLARKHQNWWRSAPLLRLIAAIYFPRRSQVRLLLTQPASRFGGNTLANSASRIMPHLRTA
jgi:hypothetical protein